MAAPDPSVGSALSFQEGMTTLKSKPGTTALEKELRLAKLEADFHRANSATRKESIELDNIRNCLLQELVEIEENKNAELKNEIQAIQVGNRSV
jgi:hypothetical protein